MEKKVTVIIPCHNSIRFLDECWESVYHQTIGIENLQVIMVDDASTDNTWELLQSYEKKAPDSVTIIHLEENLRQGGARNKALGYAEGKYIRFLDSDDVLPLNSTEELYNLAEEYKTDLIFYNGEWLENGGYYHDPIEKDEFIYIGNADERKKFLLHPHVSCSHSMIFYRRCFVEKVDSKFAEKLIYEEPLFVYPLLFYTQRALLCADTHYMVRSRNDSTMSSEILPKLRQQPQVQMLLLKDVVNRGLLTDYYDIIEWYFLENYFLLPMYNLREGNCGLTIEEFKEMQRNCKEFFPDYKNNPFIKLGYEKYYQAIEEDFSSLEDVIRYKLEMKLW